MAKTVKPLGEHPSKQEEISFFESVVAMVPKDSYLAQMLTREFIIWVEESIRNDSNLDIYADCQYEMKSSRGLNDNLVGMSNQIAHLTEQCARFQKERNALEILAKERDQLLLEAQYNANAMLMQFDELRKKVSYDTDKINAQQDEIETLKAMLSAVVTDTPVDIELKVAARMLVREWTQQ